MHEGGRPSDYDPAFCHIAHEMAQRGATVREVAEALECTERTIYRWIHAHPEFSQAMELGKEAADNRVEDSLYRRATGYSFDAIKINQFEGVAVITPYVEHVPPDVGAIQFWLKNRRGEKWRDKHDVEMNGNVTLTCSPLDEAL
jgi:hypothetical protein